MNSKGYCAAAPPPDTPLMAARRARRPGYGLVLGLFLQEDLFLFAELAAHVMASGSGSGAGSPAVPGRIHSSAPELWRSPIENNDS